MATTPRTTQLASQQSAFDFKLITSYDQQQVPPGIRKGNPVTDQVKKREGPYANRARTLPPQHEQDNPKPTQPHPHHPCRYTNRASSTIAAHNTRAQGRAESWCGFRAAARPFRALGLKFWCFLMLLTPKFRDYKRCDQRKCICGGGGSRTRLPGFASVLVSECFPWSGDVSGCSRGCLSSPVKAGELRQTRVSVSRPCQVCALTLRSIQRRWTALRTWRRRSLLESIEGCSGSSDLGTTKFGS